MPKNCKDVALWNEFRVWTDAGWTSPHMADYCYKKAQELARLFSGRIVPIEKESIETRFCFGYSDWYGPTQEEAWAAARQARTSEDHFMAENMKKHRRLMEELDKHGKSTFAVLFPAYGKDNKIWELGFRDVCDVLDAFGGPAYLDELKGRELEFRGCTGYVCTDDDVLQIEAALDRATKAHEKKCRAYLKRHGLSKLKVWTYWRDE